jgi:hypothetical protein
MDREVIPPQSGEILRLLWSTSANQEPVVVTTATERHQRGSVIVQAATLWFADGGRQVLETRFRHVAGTLSDQ